MKVCIAEKPSVAREIARILNANSRKDGYFEGNGYQVTWTFGHLCTLKTPDDYTPQWKSWRLNMLPMIPPRFGIKLIDNDGIEKQFNTIKSLLENCDEVINCGDAGIEGEVIQRWVILKAQCNKPLKRLWISSMTDEAIKEGFEKLKNGADFDRLYAAGNARAVGDWLLGMNASRLYTLKYANGKGVLSIGRVQTPTLALIVNRHEEIQNFVPEPFWEIKTNYREVTFNSTKGRYSSVEEAQKVIDEIKTEPFEIISFEKKKGKEAPLKLFDLTALQVECNKKFNFSADETLKLIQGLYEKKMVTYPRVDTTFLPTDMHPKIAGILKKMEPYANFTGPILQKPIKKNKKIFDDKKITDHHAIVPTGVAPTGLQQDEKRVYDAIARRFIAAFYPDCMVMNTTVMGETGKHEFKATGKIIESEGWRVLYPKKGEKGSGKNEQIMPHFEKGEKGEHKPDLLEKQTQPPKYYTEATLLRAMETAGKQVDDEELRDAMKENGIGRPSTRSNIIETLFRRRFVVRERKNLVPTQTGVQLIHTIKNDLLKSAELTGMWEKKLRQIETGQYEAKQFLEEMKQMVTDLVIEVKRESHKTITIEEEKEVKQKKTGDKPKTKKNPAQNTDKQVVLTCPKCKKGTILKGSTAFGCSNFKNGCDFKIMFEQYGKKLTDNQIQTLIQKGITRKIKNLVVNGESIEGVLKLGEGFEVVVG
ncbi:MAG: DNA topoisomerase 3 [Prolixibacteraceae bacterium]|nr:DNA topoisomerase 3 [Prolixibacteraceae bacterium]